MSAVIYLLVRSEGNDETNEETVICARSTLERAEEKKRELEAAQVAEDELSQRYTEFCDQVELDHPLPPRPAGRPTQEWFNAMTARQNTIIPIRFNWLLQHGLDHEKATWVSMFSWIGNTAVSYHIQETELD